MEPFPPNSPDSCVRYRSLPPPRSSPLSGGRFIRALVLALLSLCLWPVGAWGQQPIIIRLAHSTFPGGLYDIVATRFAKEANQAL